ncbi:hypothetical protein [uncultured Secundilactobacillus sp.]|uniref:hypothetical protein n=1 Tax=uncultured Secundilactobacillus sp. TaxID=2813935 RepID=UPI002586BE49|nr:hypothetical protein [uncultured Secundilactobacillus sp.]
MKSRNLINSVLLALGAVLLMGVMFINHAQAATPYYTQSINKGAGFIKSHTAKQSLDSWDALAVRRSPYGMSTAAKKVFIKSLAGQFSNLRGHYAAVDYERSLIGAVSIGYNPAKYRGKNLVSGIVKTAPKSNSGITAKIFGIIALSTKNYGKTSNATVKTLLSQVVKAQNTQGGWALNGTGSDVDITGMALMALGMHRGYSSVQRAVIKAVNLLKKTAFQKSTGDFVISSAFTKKANANSDAMAIAGLSAVGVDTEKTLKTKGGVTPVRRLIKYQKSNGQFRWLAGSNTGSLQMATQQATYALEQYRNLKLKKGSIFNF